MMKLLSGILIVLFLASGCASTGEKPIEIYTFTKDRVDQKIEGNRGYLEGTPTEEVSGERSTTRTLIGIDIMLPGSYKDEAEVAAQGEKEPVTKEAKVVEKVVIEEVPAKSQQAASEIKEEIEEDWIK